MCTVPPPPGGYPIAVKYIISYQTDFIYTKAHGAAEKILQSKAFKVKSGEAFSINV
jgi:hypothetical protein